MSRPPMSPRPLMALRVAPRLDNFLLHWVPLFDPLSCPRTLGLPTVSPPFPCQLFLQAFLTQAVRGSCFRCFWAPPPHPLLFSLPSPHTPLRPVVLRVVFLGQVCFPTRRPFLHFPLIVPFAVFRHRSLIMDLGVGLDPPPAL